MKKIIYIFILLTGLLVSCSNDPIDIDSVKTKEPIYYNTLTITVDPSDLFSSYTFQDTHHAVKSLKNLFPTFNSEEKRFIQWRTLIYDENEQLVDSVVEYLSNTNSLTKELQLVGGDYYAVTTLTFTDTLKKSMWDLIDKEKMSTVKLQPKSRWGMWNVMSQSSDKFSISQNRTARIATVPKPVGCIVYSVWENFSKWDTKIYGDSLEQVALYTKDVTESYNLDPNATNRYNMLDELGENTWYYQDYYHGSLIYLFADLLGRNYTYSYSYIFNTDKVSRQIYGYSVKKKDGFGGGYGKSDYKTMPGKTYLSYWDYDNIGNPYFGEADNNHWDRSK